MFSVCRVKVGKTVPNSVLIYFRTPSGHSQLFVRSFHGKLDLSRDLRSLFIPINSKYPHNLKVTPKYIY